MKLQLLLLAIFADNFTAFKTAYKSYQAVYNLTDGTYSRSTIRGQIAHLLEEGYLEKIVRNGQVYFSLTLSGFRRVIYFSPNYKNPSWDNKWRIIIFNIAEKDRRARDKLRQIIKKFGFGKLSGSVYITPFNIKQEVMEKITEPVFIFEARSLVDNREITRLAFELDSLRKYYTDWIVKTRKKASVKEGIKLVEEYFDIVIRYERGLPSVLLPEKWPQIGCWKIFIGLLGKDR